MRRLVSFSTPPLHTTDHFPAASKAIWNFDGLYCESRHIPGVKFPGLIHPGLARFLSLSLSIYLSLSLSRTCGLQPEWHGSDTGRPAAQV